MRINLFWLTVILFLLTKVEFGGASSKCRPNKADLWPFECEIWKDLGHCLTDPSFMWVNCGESCSDYATCECETLDNSPADLQCTCGEFATAVMCEDDSASDIALNCSFTCSRRLDPINFCTPIPIGVTLPDNSKWTLSRAPHTSFNGKAGYLQTAIITCNFGYQPKDTVSNGMRICDPFQPNSASGNWARVVSNNPTCLPMVCPDPPSIQGAYHMNPTNGSIFYYNDTVTYYCGRDGEVMTKATDPTARCSLRGPKGWSWADQEPVCSPVPCEPVDNGLNTYHNISKDEPSGIVTYTCLPGYNPKPLTRGYFVKICQPDGTWLPEQQPECSIARCGPPTLEPNTEIKGWKPVSYYGDIITVFCLEGYSSLYIEPGTEDTPLGSITNTCLETGEWSTNTISCLKKACSLPEGFEIKSYRIANKTSDLMAVVSGTVIAFACDYTQGYAANSSNSAVAYWRCNENATWEKEPLECSQGALLEEKLKSVKHQIIFESQHAVATGSIVLGILALFLGTMVAIDCLTIGRDLRRLRHNWRHFTKRLRDSARLKQLHNLRVAMRTSFAKEFFWRGVDAYVEGQRMAAANFAPDLTAVVIHPMGSRPATATSNLHKEGAMDIASVNANA